MTAISRESYLPPIAPDRIRSMCQRIRVWGYSYYDIQKTFAHNGITFDQWRNDFPEFSDANLDADIETAYPDSGRTVASIEPLTQGLIHFDEIGIYPFFASVETSSNEQLESRLWIPRMSIYFSAPDDMANAANLRLASAIVAGLLYRMFSIQLGLCMLNCFDLDARGRLA